MSRRRYPHNTLVMESIAADQVGTACGMICG
jgi:hypothetical protein